MAYLKRVGQRYKILWITILIMIPFPYILNEKNLYSHGISSSSFYTQTIPNNGSSVYEWQNLSFTSPTISNAESYFLQHLTICIGVHKGGTSSLAAIMRQSPYMIADGKEFHYFDRLIFKKGPEHKSEPLQDILNFTYSNNLGVTQYIQTLADYYHIHINNESFTDRSIFEKTPCYIIQLNAAYVIANDFIQYGTKLLLLLRNPNKRLISDYFHSKQYFKKRNRLNFFTNSTIDEYIGHIKSEPQIVFVTNQLNSLQYQHTPSVLMKIIDIWQHMFYVSKENKPFRTWYRSCYAPGIIAWIYYIQQFNTLPKYKHSFKIIQSEIFYDPQTYHETLKYILCYTHYNIHNDNYDEWMTECVQKDIYHAADQKQEQKASQTPNDLQLSMKQMNEISESFLGCNKWLRLIIDTHSPDILLTNSFNWSYIE